MTIRIAPDVPSVKANRFGPIAPPPTFAQAPSPNAGNHGTFRSTGHRAAYARSRLVTGVSRSISGASRSRAIPVIASISASHASRQTSSIPVPEAIAIETPAASRPCSRPIAYSANEHQRATRPNTSGAVARSHRNFAGQKLEWRGHPVRACIAATSISRRSSSTCRTDRVSAQ